MRAGAGGLQCLLDVQRWVKQLQGGVGGVPQCTDCACWSEEGPLVCAISCASFVHRAGVRRSVSADQPRGVLSCQLPLFMPSWRVASME